MSIHLNYSAHEQKNHTKKNHIVARSWLIDRVEHLQPAHLPNVPLFVCMELWKNVIVVRTVHIGCLIFPPYSNVSHAQFVVVSLPHLVQVELLTSFTVSSWDCVPKHRTSNSIGNRLNALFEWNWTHFFVVCLVSFERRVGGGGREKKLRMIHTNNSKRTNERKCNRIRGMAFLLMETI